MSDVLALHAKAVAEFDRRVHVVGPGQWRAATPCAEWDVRALVNHMVYEHLWVPPLLDSATIEEIGHRFDGDQLGDDPVARWEKVTATAIAQLSVPGVLHRAVHLSYGDVTAGEYCAQLTIDITVHAWDLAQAIGVDDRLDVELATRAYHWTLPQLARQTASGLFADPVGVPEDADPQTKLIALCGRDPFGPLRSKGTGAERTD
ncbi:DinB family protein [Flindersiella endophytica]